MAITLDALTKSTAATFQHTCSGGDRFLFVCAATPFEADEETVSITYGGVAVDAVEVVQLGEGISLYVGHMVNPPSGTHDVVVTTIASSVLVEAASYNGVAQVAPVYRTTTGAGLSVSEMPLHSFCKTNCLTIGIGAANNVNCEVTGVADPQTLVWNETGNGMRMEGVSIIGTVDADDFPIPNALTIPADWVMVVLGVTCA